MKYWLMATPSSTTTNGPGMNLNNRCFLKIGCSHNINIEIDKPPTKIATGVKALNALSNSENVLALSPWANVSSPSKSASNPTKCGNCFKINIKPIAANMPLITEFGI